MIGSLPQFGNGRGNSKLGRLSSALPHSSSYHGHEFGRDSELMPGEVRASQFSRCSVNLWEDWSTLQGDAMRAGRLGTYIHGRGKIGVLVEVSCNSEFRAQSDEVQKLVHDIAMQIAATNPKFIRKEQVPPEVLEEQIRRYRFATASVGKPKEVMMRLIEGVSFKIYEELCLYEQPFIKDASISIKELIAGRTGAVGEEIRVRRFVRFNLGERDATVATDLDSDSEGGNESGFIGNRPKSPKGGVGSSAVRRNAK